MHNVRKLLCSFACGAALLLGGSFSIHAQAAEGNPPERIKVLRVGSSSFSYDLIENTRSIVEASGRYQLICAPRVDGAGVRLDKFFAYPGMYEEWRDRVIPKIKAGNYDYVIIQTIGWLGLTPEQQKRLCTEILPDMAHLIRDAGARVILYDKYLRPKRKGWVGRYPEGYRLNYLLHIWAAKNAGIEKISFGGEAVTELWSKPQFARVGFFIGDGHPSVFSNHISAINFAYLLTGEDPVGNPVRELPLAGMRRGQFMELGSSDNAEHQKVYEDLKDRVKEDSFVLTDEEARTLQEMAMKSQRKWGGLLRENLESDEVFAKTMKEIERIQGEMDKYEEYGLDENFIARQKAKFAPPEAPGELKPHKIRSIIGKTKRLEYLGAQIRKYSMRMPVKKRKEVNRAFAQYWDEKDNSKLRDELIVEAKILHEKRAQGLTSKRPGKGSGMIGYVYVLPAWRLIFENLPEDQVKAALEHYNARGIRKAARRDSPAFAAYQHKHRNDLKKLIQAWDIYLDIFRDPNRLDELRDNNYPIEVIHEADKEFERRIKALEGEASAP